MNSTESISAVHTVQYVSEFEITETFLRCTAVLENISIVKPVEYMDLIELGNINTNSPPFESSHAILRLWLGITHQPTEKKIYIDTVHV